MGYSRDSFYRFKELYDSGGELALQEISRKKPCLRNHVDERIEQAVLAMTLEQPAYGQLRTSNELKKQGLFISSGGVRCIWLRHDLDDFRQAVESPVGESRARRLDPERRPVAGVGARQTGEAGARRDRDGASRLSRLAGHFLCRHAQGRRAHLPADFHRHVHQSRRLQTLRPQARADRRRHSTTGCCRSSRPKTCRSCAC